MIISILIFIFGFVFLYSASVSYGMQKAGMENISFHGAILAVKQLLFGLLGIGLMILGYKIKSEFWYKWAYHILVLGLIAMLLVFVPHLGYSAGGARRWIRLGFISFQPSEFVKLAMIIYLARSLPNKGDKVDDFWMGFFPYFFILTVIAVILFFQRDLGSVLLLGYVTFLLLFVGGSPIKYLVGSLTVGGIVVVLKEVMNTYRLGRIKAFLFPWEHFKSYGYQLAQSYIALSNGGITGRSPGASLQKLYFLPEAHTDFIFAIIGEEGGFLISTIFIIAYAYLIYLGFKITWHQKERFHLMLAMGIVSLLGMEIFINLSVVTGMLPTKGLPLPLVSYGGSNLLMTFLMIGILARLGENCGEM